MKHGDVSSHASFGLRGTMRTQSADTHPDIERIQFDMLRRAGATERVRLTRSLSETVMQMCWRSLEEANPGASEQEIGIKFVEFNYGKTLADAVRTYLERQAARAQQTAATE